MKTKHMARLFAAIGATLLVACGGGGGEAPAPVAESAQASPMYDKVFIVGNSHTRADMNPAIGWNHDWGAIASSRERDYAHIVAANYGVALEIVSGISNEQSPAAPLPRVSITSRTLAIIFLGDNGLPGRYAEIAASMKHAKTLLCISTWWVAYDRDDVMRTACTLAGGKFVYVGDVFHGRLGLYENEALDSHPGDGGHAELARRMIATAEGQP